MNIAIITPTGGRPKQIQLCAEFMHRQDYEGKVLWVIVDDVLPVTTKFISNEFRDNWKVLKIYPQKKWMPGLNTQASNLLKGIDIIAFFEVDYVFIIEDDDYYSPQYLSVMMEKLKGCDVAGQMYTIYYDVVNRGWMRNGNVGHASLFQVAFRLSVLDTFKAICTQKNKFIDMSFFRAINHRKVNLFDGQDLAIGIKGLPGRAGIGMGHRMDVKMTSDVNFEKLKELIGEDYKYYE
jgi:hypothetical protein